MVGLQFPNNTRNRQGKNLEMALPCPQISPNAAQFFINLFLLNPNDIQIFF